MAKAKRVKQFKGRIIPDIGSRLEVLYRVNKQGAPIWVQGEVFSRTFARKRVVNMECNLWPMVRGTIRYPTVVLRLCSEGKRWRWPKAIQPKADGCNSSSAQTEPLIGNIASHVDEFRFNHQTDKWSKVS